MKDLRYSHYNGHSAFATATLLVDNCRPNCVTGGHYVKATAYFYDVFDHKGPGRNFGYLRLRWDHRRHSTLLWIDSEGQWWWAALGTPPRQT
jgi:hypothetical protein